jgi:transposase
MTRKRKQYTQEFRDSAVKLITEQGGKVAEAAQNSGINRSVLGRWLRESEADGDNGSNVSSGKELQTGLTRLRKENQRLKLEREILKKAAAFFAGGSGCGIN